MKYGSIMARKLTTGGDVDSWCTKCKMMILHTIVAMVDDSGIAEQGEAWLNDNFLRNERGFVQLCRADLAGARAISN